MGIKGKVVCLKAALLTLMLFLVLTSMGFYFQISGIQIFKIDVVRSVTQFQLNSKIQNFLKSINLRSGKSCIKATSSYQSQNASMINQTRQHPMCQVQCVTGEFCEYLDEVDFRVIVITFDRPQSLSKCLNRLETLQMDGDTLSVHIWIDRSTAGSINDDVKRVTLDFQRFFKNKSGKNARVCFHEQSQHANIVGQWVNTWRPKENTREIGLILEDDIDLSPFSYRWLKAVHGKYDKVNDIAGVTLQMENIKFMRGGGPMRGPKGDTVFLYPVLGTWGYSPTANKWREFQDWHHANYKNKTVKPYVPNLITTSWYRGFERVGTHASMWEQWHIYFSYIRHYYTVYCNLATFTRKQEILLGSNRMEPGLHFHGKGHDNTKNLMKIWKDDFTKFPKTIARLQYDGNRVFR